MKPNIQKIESENGREKTRVFPVTDCNYHALTFGGFSGRSLRAAGPSFRSISREYLDTEDRHYFLAEACVFTAFMVTAAVPLVSGALAILNLVRVFGGV